MALAARRPERVAGLAISGATAEPVGPRGARLPRPRGDLPARVPEPVLDRGQPLVLPVAVSAARSPSRSSRPASRSRAAPSRVALARRRAVQAAAGRLSRPEPPDQRRVRPVLPADRAVVRGRRRGPAAGPDPAAPPTSTNLDQPEAFTARDPALRGARRGRGGRRADPGRHRRHRRAGPGADGILGRPPTRPRPRFHARSQGCLPRRRLGHPVPPRHQGPAEGDAAARRQAGDPVRRRGGRRRRHRAGDHRHLEPEAGDRGPLRHLLRAGAPARGEGRHRDAPPDPAHLGPGPGHLRPAEGAARPRPRRPRRRRRSSGTSRSR